MKAFWKRFKKYIIAAVVILLLFWIFSPKQTKVEYTTEKAQRATVEQIVSVTGTVESENKIDLHFQKPGKIGDIAVKVGDEVKKDDLLAALDTKQLDIQVRQAQAGVELARANLNLKIAGVSKEQIAVSQKDIDTAQVAYEAALNTAETVRRSATEAEKKSRLAVDTAQVSLANAQVAYDNAVASGGTTTETSNQALENAYDDAKTTIGLALITLKTTVPLADSILGIDQQYNNDGFDVYLGALNSQARVNAENGYPVVKDAAKKLDTQYTSLLSTWKPEDVDKLLSDMQTGLFQGKKLMQDIYATLVGSLIAGNFTQTTVDGYKASMSAQETALGNEIRSIQTVAQAISSAKLGIASTQSSTSTSVDNAKAALDTAKNNLSTAESALSQTLADNQKLITNAESDIQLKSVAVQKAKASYNLTTAAPREVDLAALRAQLDQAEATYSLAQQNVADAQIFAPLDGVITQVNGEVGENTSGSEIVIRMISPQLTVTANVSETDITKVHLDDKVAMTLDAFPPDVVLDGKVTKIDPAETVVQGVIYYQVKTLFTIDNPEIKSGMTANLDILAAKKENILSLSPQAIQYKDNQPFVRLLLNGQPQDRMVKLGLQGNERVEVLEGVQEGDEIVLFEKK